MFVLLKHLKIITRTFLLLFLDVLVKRTFSLSYIAIFVFNNVKVSCISSIFSNKISLSLYNISLENIEEMQETLTLLNTKIAMYDNENVRFTKTSKNNNKNINKVNGR